MKLREGWSRLISMTRGTFWWHEGVLIWVEARAHTYACSAVSHQQHIDACFTSPGACPSRHQQHAVRISSTQHHHPILLMHQGIHSMQFASTAHECIPWCSQCTHTSTAH
eukprot:scaffold291833_cov28-Tisochrysis_lutea.AAC.1